jgi:methylglutaconyl-CoA hydratase
MSTACDTSLKSPVIVSLVDGVLNVTLNDEAGRNVLSVALMHAFKDALDRAASDTAVRVVLVTNVGGVFCAGADLKAAPDESTADLFVELLRQIQTLPKPTIARITGHALGGGVGLAAAFDISIASEGSKFGFTEVRLGVVPAVISAICLPKMRRGDAMEAFLRGNRFDARRAAELGIVTRAVPLDAIDAEIGAIVDDVTLGGPHALAMAKQIIEEVPQMTPVDALHAMAALSANVFASPEARAGTEAFKQRRSPPWVKRET